MRIYVAASSKELDRAKRVIAMVERSEGLKITFDWTKDIEQATVPDASLLMDARCISAGADLRGVWECDVLWLLMPAVSSFGAATEHGYAIAKGKRVVTSGCRDTGIWRVCAEAVFVNKDMRHADDMALLWLLSESSQVNRHSVSDRTTLVMKPNPRDGCYNCSRRTCTESGLYWHCPETKTEDITHFVRRGYSKPADCTSWRYETGAEQNCSNCFRNDKGRCTARILAEKDVVVKHASNGTRPDWCPGWIVRTARCIHGFEQGLCSRVDCDYAAVIP